MPDIREKSLILLADDDAEMRRLVHRSLADSGYEFIEARDGEEALTLIIQEQPDLVVLDVMMPTLNGWEICKYVRSKPEYASVRVVMLTAIGANTNALTAPLYGADAYLDKPFEITELSETVARVLAQNTGADKQSTRA